MSVNSFAIALATQAAETAEAAGENTAAPQSGGLSPMILMLVVFFIMIFFMMRSQKRQQRKREEAINALTKGAKVRTAGGIYGTISEVRENSFVVEVAPDVKIEFARTAVIENLDAPADASGKKDEPGK